MSKKINEQDLYNNIEFYANELKNGKIFVLPTGTIYGICTNALNKQAVKRIYKIKRREYNKPLIVLVDSFKMLKKICCDLNDLEIELASKFWPGPLTMILKKRKIVPNVVTANNDTIGVRIDSSQVVNTLIEKSGVPIVAPSANVSGNLNINSIELLEDEVKDRVDYIVDTGILDNVVESTIVKVEDNNIEILREGKLSKKEIFNLK